MTPTPRALLAIAVGLAACSPASGEPVDPSTTPPAAAGTQRWELGLSVGLPLSALVDSRSSSHLYVAAKEGGLRVLQLRGATPPVEVASLPIGVLGGHHATALAQQGSTLFVGLGDFFNGQGARAGVVGVDVSDPAQPRIRSRWVSPAVMSGVTAVLANGTRLFVAAKREGVLVFDISGVDSTPLLTTILPDPDFPKDNPGPTEYPNARGLAVDGARLYVANDAGGLRIIDISNLAAPVEIGRYVNPGVVNKPRAYNSVHVVGNRAYLAVDYCGLEIVDVTMTSNPRRVGWWNPWACDTPANTWFNSAGHTNQLVFDAARRLVYLSSGASQLVAVDVSDETRPVLALQFRAAATEQGAWGVAAGPSELYLTYITALLPFRGTWSGIRSITPVQAVP